MRLVTDKLLLNRTSATTVVEGWPACFNSFYFSFRSGSLSFSHAFSNPTLGRQSSSDILQLWVTFASASRRPSKFDRPGPHSQSNPCHLKFIRTCKGRPHRTRSISRISKLSRGSACRDSTSYDRRCPQLALADGLRHSDQSVHYHGEHALSGHYYDRH